MGRGSNDCGEVGAESMAERWLKYNEGPDGHQCPERGCIGFGHRLSAETTLTFSYYLQRSDGMGTFRGRQQLCFEVNVDRSGVRHQPTVHPTAPGVEVIEGPHDLRRTQNEFSTNDKC